MKLVVIVMLVFFYSQSQSLDLINDHLKPSVTNGFDKNGFIILGVGTTLGFIAQTSDHYMREVWRDHKQMPKNISQIGDAMGTGVPGILIATSQTIIDSQREFGISHFEALTLSTLSTYALKYSNKRKRPFSDDKLSMPSGHTSTTFTTATNLTYAYGWWGAIPSYLLATLTGFSRLSDNAHWFSDTIIGATLGIFWGRATHFHHFQIAPQISDNYKGVNLAINF